MKRLVKTDVFGFLKPLVDAHTMGMFAMAQLLRDCGYKVVTAPPEIMEAANHPKKLNNGGAIAKWVENNNISVLCFSYRLNPQDGSELFCSVANVLKEHGLVGRNGQVKMLSFSGLADTCRLVAANCDFDVLLFQGGESPVESLSKYGVPESLMPHHFKESHPYDTFLNNFARRFIESERYKLVTASDHFGYAKCGKEDDTYEARLKYCLSKRSLPIIRLHAGPYSPNRLEALKMFGSWCKDLAKSNLLDVLSIGSSQLTQSNFGEDWDGLNNGGGIPVNSEAEYRQIALDSKPMLVRTYSGTKNVPRLARIHEESLNISWHALSLWWFCELDGRGPNTLLDNLREHVEAFKYAAATNKPVEPNVSHHFSFRGGDDVTAIVSVYLAAKTIKKSGVRHMILQDMLNTPKYTWAVQDIAKGRAMLKMVRSLEDSIFKVSLQLRAGLDYFEPDLDKAKVQLATVTALMDDIEPDNVNSPEIVHVVSYSEAVRLATPYVMKESIRITLGALNEYRYLKRLHQAWNTKEDKEIEQRYANLVHQSQKAIEILENNIPNLYTPEGLYKVYINGFLPTPYILDPEKKFPNATKWQTAVVNGGVEVIDDAGKVITTEERYKAIISRGLV